MAFNSFNWGKMKQTPAGNAERNEGLKRKEMSLQDLTNSYERQANKDVQDHEDFGELLKDVDRNINELNRGSEETKLEIAREIADRHGKTISDVKGIDDEMEQIAYVLALAKAKQPKQPKLN